MAEYIDRDALIGKLALLAERYHALGQEKVVQDYNWAITVLDGAPVVDVEPVVRCAVCQYGDWDSKNDDALVCTKTNDGYWRSGKDFCSFGKRKEVKPHKTTKTNDK